MYERTKPRFPFAPWNATPEQLIRTFVGRKSLLMDILNRIISVGNGATPKHSLLVGQRGLGKTHLLCLIHHYVSGNLPHPEEIDGSFKEWTSVLFVEEEYATSNTLANFLIYLCKKLKEIDPGEELWQLPENIIDQSDQTIFDCCFEHITDFSQKRQKKICILIDNLQKIFEDFTEEDQHSLRVFLTDQSAILLICSSQGIFKQIIDHAAPFYEYFEIDFIPELTEKEMLLMLKSRFEEDGLENEYKKREMRLNNTIPGIRKLTGGNPRLVLFLYDILLQSQTLFDIELSLKGTIDQLTDYFRGRLGSLPAQSRKILDTIAQMEGPSTPTEIARFSRLPVQIVNAQIKRLKQWGYIEPSKRVKKRSTRYDITDRLFRIWRQSATVAGKQRFKLFTEFLKILYTHKELEQRFIHYDWNMLLDYEIAKACLFEYGADMEKLQDFILKTAFPDNAPQIIFNYILKISSECYKRGDNNRGESLFTVGVSINSWHKEKWFGRELGLYLRNLLDTGPSLFHCSIDKVREKVHEKDVLDLLNPYMQASDFARTGDVSILERLFPEVLEIVVEIARKLNPDIGKV